MSLRRPSMADCGGVAGCGGGGGGHLHSVRSTSYDSASEGGLPGWQQSRLAEEQGVREAGFKEELRIELVTDVATAISELAEAEARDFTGSPNFGLGPQVSVIGAPVRTMARSGSGSFGADAVTDPAGGGGGGGAGDSFALPPSEGGASCLSGGLQVSPDSSGVLEFEDSSSNSTGASPMRWAETPRIRRHGGGGAFAAAFGGGASATGSERRHHVHHYAVAHFRAIRQTFGISAESFAAAFRRHESSDSARLLRESVSEGATGSFFYWVKNQDGTDTGYIVKQITKTEKDTLMSILPAYKAHVQSRGGASLLHYLSCHSMQLRWQWSGKVYFVVMRNFFPVRPQLSFDLKGATANRRALNTWELHQTNTVAGKYSTLRDWEWMDIGMTTDLEDRDKARIWAMICADCEFLHRQHILDYSLLLGIYRPPASLVPQAKQQRLQELASQCRGTGVVSRDRQKVYFFGIIDVLEKFTIRWRIQRAVLRLLYWLACRWAQSDGISAMPPPLYADRFRTFMAHEVLHMEEAHPTSSVLDDRFRAGQCCAAVYAWLRRLFGLPEAGRSQRKGGKARWQPLWERRRRGLVKERIVSEQEDQAARIKELEEHLSWLEYELATARGVHAAALQPLPERPDTLEFSAGRSTTVDSHAHGWSLLPRTAR